MRACHCRALWCLRAERSCRYYLLLETPATESQSIGWMLSERMTAAAKLWHAVRQEQLTVDQILIDASKAPRQEILCCLSVARHHSNAPGACVQTLPRALGGCSRLKLGPQVPTRVCYVANDIRAALIETRAALLAEA